MYNLNRVKLYRLIRRLNVKSADLSCIIQDLRNKGPPTYCSWPNSPFLHPTMFLHPTEASWKLLVLSNLAKFSHFNVSAKEHPVATGDESREGIACFLSLHDRESERVVCCHWIKFLGWDGTRRKSQGDFPCRP